MMVFIVKVLGLYLVAMGMVFMISPKRVRSFINFWKQANRIYLAGAIRILLGAVLLAAAPACRLNILVSVLGLLIVAGGALIFFMKKERVMRIISWYEGRSDNALRMMGFPIIGIGLLIVYAV